MSAKDISLEARRIHFSSIVFDTHTDTPQRFLFDHFDLGSRDSEGCVDIPRLREGGVNAIFFVLWVPLDITGPPATSRAFELLDAVQEQIRLHSNDLALATSCGAVRKIREQEKIAILLGVEGGHAIDNNLSVLREFSEHGVRYMTLTHNAATDWADSSNHPPRHGGLTRFGREVITEMNRLGMMVDVSHVSDETFFDVMDLSRAPVIASHSCCRTICNAPRNMSDQMIRALAARGGVIHITFHNAFLSQEYLDGSRTIKPTAPIEEAETPDSIRNEARKLIEEQSQSDTYIRDGKLPQVRWEKIVEHVEHVIRLVGPSHVGIGSDFDGAFMPEGMRSAASFPKITEALLRKGYGESEVCRILGENTLRVMAECERIASEFQSEKA